MTMERANDIIKLSAPATREFWEIPVLFEDEHLLALNKPALLLTSPDRSEPQRPSLIKLLHAGIERDASWAKGRGLAYVMNAHRLDFETSGVILFAKSKPVLIELANSFGSNKPLKRYVALVRGEPTEEKFTVDAKLAPHPVQPGSMRVDPKHGKKSETQFEVAEKFVGWTLLNCFPLTDRPHQIRVHLKHAGFPVVADKLYSGKPLWLSRLKRDYKPNKNEDERPLIARVALHAEQLTIDHPVTKEPLVINSPLPKDFSVALKYLRKYAK
jgi:RluA family pseudouridine synthase